jgi:quinol-cytochrome oxidoreductase complex cytochrome b subunit
MLKVWVIGLAPPCVAVKERLVGLVPMAGGITGGGATVGVKIARLLLPDSLLAPSKAVTK